MLDQDNNFYLISLNILVTCLLDNVRILWGEVSCWSLLGVKGLRKIRSIQQSEQKQFINFIFGYLGYISLTNVVSTMTFGWTLQRTAYKCSKWIIRWLKVFNSTLVKNKTKQNKTTIMDNIITFVSFCSSVKIVLFSSYQQQPQLVSCCKICTDIRARFSKLPKKKTIAIRFLFSFV